MKTINIFFYSLIFFGISIFTLDVVSVAMINKHIHQFIFDDKGSATQTMSKLNKVCNPRIALDLTGSVDSHLTKLSEYQNVCDSFVTDQEMIFNDLPKDGIIAKKSAETMSVTLKEFSRYGVKPIVVVEPVTEWGLVDFEEFKSGFYNDWIETYFKTLKDNGVTDKEMGIWVPFPEANLPYWNHASASAQDFSAIVNQYLEIMKKYFPKSKASILLNSATYATDDFDWRKGEYLSLIPYVKDIDRKYIDSFGLQGFPWMPPLQESGNAIKSADEFINYHLAVEAAQALGVKKIWFNTGTFSQKYTNDNSKMVVMSPGERQAILKDIHDEALKAKNSGYEVFVNIFAEDKSLTEEATNWSYWSEEDYRNSKDAIAFANFATMLYKDGIGLSIFDETK